MTKGCIGSRLQQNAGVYGMKENTSDLLGTKEHGLLAEPVEISVRIFANDAFTKALGKGYQLDFFN
jgi:hypothetical protein